MFWKIFSQLKQISRMPHLKEGSTILIKDLLNLERVKINFHQT